MLDGLLSTFMGQQLGIETRGYSFFVPGLARLHFFISQKRGSPPVNICTNVCVLCRPETCWIDDAVNGQLCQTGQNIFSLYPAAVIYRIGSINCNSFFFFSTNVYVWKGT